MAKKSKFIRSKKIYRSKKSADAKVWLWRKGGVGAEKRKVKGGYRVYVNRAEVEELPF
jgi:hypothetical protein